jgi:AcrR family transcriptional regulator
MARRTKDEAEQTRNSILDAAEYVFYKHGVARTSLEEIAAVAKVTRGAVYWHFKDKSAICAAMMDRVFLPQEDMLEKLISDQSDQPLEDMEEACCHSLLMMVRDKRRQRVVTIVTQRCEYVKDMAPMMKRRNLCKNRMLQRVELLFKRAKKLGHLAPHWSAHHAALTFQALMTGLIYSTLEGRKNYNLSTTAPDCIKAFMQSLHSKTHGS